MKSSTSTILLALVAVSMCRVDGFSVAPPTNARGNGAVAPLAEATATMAESGIPPATADSSPAVEDVTIPTNLPSEKGMDYIPLATMLATGQLAEADQVRYINKPTTLG